MNVPRDGMLRWQSDARCRALSGTLSTGLILAAAAALCGCQDYYSTGPRMGPYDYDIHRFNKLTQEAEPGSLNRWQTFIAEDGSHAVSVYERYRSGAASKQGRQQSSGATIAGQAGGYGAAK